MDHFSKALENTGKPCYEECNERQGPCTFCGTGLCCKKNAPPSNGCHGANGGDHQYECGEAGKPLCITINIWKSIRVFSLHF